MWDVEYRGFLITARVRCLPGGGVVADVIVSRTEGERVFAQCFTVAGPHAEAETARRAAVEHAQAIVDGRLPGLARAVAGRETACPSPGDS